MDEKDAISLRNFEINQLNPNNLEFPISYKLTIIPERGVKGKSRGIADKEIHIDIKYPTQIEHTATHDGLHSSTFNSNIDGYDFISGYINNQKVNREYLGQLQNMQQI